MSIIASIPYGEEEILILSTKLWYKKNIFYFLDEKNEGCPKLYEGLFDIRTSFLMDGEAKKIAGILKNQMVCENPVSKSTVDQTVQHHFSSKVKRRKLEVMTIPKDMEELEKLKKLFHDVSQTTSFDEFFNFCPTPIDFEENNKISRLSREQFLSMSEVPLEYADKRNDTSSPLIHSHANQMFSIPPHSRYILGDVSVLSEVFKGLFFDFVVMDPPWQNKHVARKKSFRGAKHSYEMMDVSSILSIPLSSILSDDAVVFIWVTNNLKIEENLRSSLSIWGLQVAATWYWVKVTRSGHPIVNFDSPKGKLPYEKVLVARKMKFEVHSDLKSPSTAVNEYYEASLPKSRCSHHKNLSGTPQETHLFHQNYLLNVKSISDPRDLDVDGRLNTSENRSHCRKEKGAVGFNDCSLSSEEAARELKVQEKEGKSGSRNFQDTKGLPIKDLVFFAVPGSVHSSKPPLNEVIERYFPRKQSGRSLELFARTIIPGWTALGKEVLRFHDIRLGTDKVLPDTESQFPNEHVSTNLNTAAPLLD